MNFKIKVVEYQQIINVPDNGQINSTLLADSLSLFQLLDKTDFIFSFLNISPCYNYTLKERQYLRYEIIY